MIDLDELKACSFFKSELNKEGIIENYFVKYNAREDVIYRKDEAGKWVQAEVKGHSLVYRKASVFIVGEDICIEKDCWPGNNNYTLLTKGQDGVYRVHDYYDNALFHPARISSVGGSLLGYLIITIKDDCATDFYFRKTAIGYERCQSADRWKLSSHYREKLSQVLSPECIQEAAPIKAVTPKGLEKS